MYAKRRCNMTRNIEYVPIRPLNLACASVFKKKFIDNPDRSIRMHGSSLPSKFFVELFTPKLWVSGLHIDWILKPFWRDFGDRLIEDRVAVLDTLFCQMLVTAANSQGANTKGAYIKWNQYLLSCVRGAVSDRTQKLAWFDDVDTVYAPMNWGQRHWVALVIHLPLRQIEILDPLVPLHSDKKVKKLMEPMVRGLPLLIEASHVNPDWLRAGGQSVDAFSYSRSIGLAENERAGDCGPMSAKFIEMHSMGCSLAEMGNLADADIDAMRIQYAQSVYYGFSKV